MDQSRSRYRWCRNHRTSVEPRCVWSSSAAQLTLPLDLLVGWLVVWADHCWKLESSGTSCATSVYAIWVELCMCVSVCARELDPRQLRKCRWSIADDTVLCCVGWPIMVRGIMMMLFRWKWVGGKSNALFHEMNVWVCMYVCIYVYVCGCVFTCVRQQCVLRVQQSVKAKCGDNNVVMRTQTASVWAISWLKRSNVAREREREKSKWTKGLDKMVINSTCRKNRYLREAYH